MEVSILRPLGYGPNTLPLRQPALCVTLASIQHIHSRYKKNLPPRHRETWERQWQLAVAVTVARRSDVHRWACREGPSCCQVEGDANMSVLPTLLGWQTGVGVSGTWIIGWIRTTVTEYVNYWMTEWVMSAYNWMIEGLSEFVNNWMTQWVRVCTYFVHNWTMIEWMMLLADILILSLMLMSLFVLRAHKLAVP